ncbi:MAG: hypothetical protein ACLQGP_22945 [Isosphaeraceae bacterium]
MSKAHEEFTQHHIVINNDGLLLRASISFQDTTAVKRIAAKHERTRRDLESAYEELQS